MCEKFGVKTPGKFASSLTPGQAVDALARASRIYALETIGFMIVGFYYLRNPSSERLASIKAVFLVSAGSLAGADGGKFALNISGKSMTAIQGMGYGDGIKIFDAAAYAFDAPFKMELFKTYSNEKGVRNAKDIKAMRELRDELRAAGGWSDTDMLAMGFF